MGYAVSSLAALVLFYGVYLGKMLLQRRSGIRTDQMGRGKQGFVRFIEIGLKCVTHAIVPVQVVCIFRVCTVLPAALRICGVAAAFAGVGFFAAAVYTMRDSWRAGVPVEGKTELITDGVFQLSRNPAFLGFELLDLGLLMVWWNPVLLAFTLAAVLFFHLQIVNCEEPFLQEAFGQDYLDYEKKVCRYLGRKHR